MNPKNIDKEVLNEVWTWNKTGDTCTSITVTIKGYLRADIKTKTTKIDQGDGYSELVQEHDFDNSTSLYTETYTYNIPEAKRWDRPLSDEEAVHWGDAIKIIYEDSDYINKRDSIKTQIEAYNG